MRGRVLDFDGSRWEDPKLYIRSRPYVLDWISFCPLCGAKITLTDITNKTSRDRTPPVAGVPTSLRVRSIIMDAAKQQKKREKKKPK